jgi:hypothetical protein
MRMTGEARQSSYTPLRAARIIYRPPGTPAAANGR